MRLKHLHFWALKTLIWLVIRRIILIRHWITSFYYRTLKTNSEVNVFRHRIGVTLINNWFKRIHKCIDFQEKYFDKQYGNFRWWRVCYTSFCPMVVNAYLGTFHIDYFSILFFVFWNVYWEKQSKENIGSFCLEKIFLVKVTLKIERIFNCEYFRWLLQSIKIRLMNWNERTIIVEQNFTQKCKL